MATLPAAEVEKLRAQLRETIDAVTTVQERTIEFEDGRDPLTLFAPAQLTQVEQEAYLGGSAPVGGFSARSKPPTGIDALTLLEDVDRRTGGYEGPDRAARLWAWAQAAASGAPDVVEVAARAATGYRAAVAAILEPSPPFRLRGQACPQCGAQKVWSRHDAGAGENYARPALQIDPETGIVTCACCPASWRHDMHEHLAAVLEQQQSETLQAEGYDPAVQARTSDEAGRGRALRPLGASSFRLPAERTEDGARRWAAAATTTVPAGRPELAARPSYAPDLSSTDPAVRQCPARVAHPEPTRWRRRRRCSGLLDLDGACPYAAQHEWEPGADEDTAAEVHAARSDAS